MAACANPGTSSTRCSNDLDDIVDSKRFHLNIHQSYAPGWGTGEACREFIQNWKDAIVKSNKLKAEEFKTVRQSNPVRRETLITASHPRTGGILGFMYFNWDEQENGILQMVNYNSRLQRRHLSLGATAKSKDNSQAGQHGEGMKLAALIMMRSPHYHAVRFESSGCSWNFNFDTNGEFVCLIKRLKKSSTSRTLRAFGKAFTYDNKRDVYLEIGAGQGGKKKDEFGQTIRTQKIPRQDFEKWLEYSLDIDPPSRQIRTPYGSLILSPAYGNKIYLRGLRLPESGQDRHPFHYGYNFWEGTTGRDRSRLDKTEEARTCIEIWQSAILEMRDNQERSDLLGKFLELWKTAKHPPDIRLPYLTNNINPQVAELMWAHLLAEANGEGIFFYSERDEKESRQIITEYFKKRPVSLNSKLWSLLGFHTTCRSPQEQQAHLFRKAAVVDPPDTDFARHMIRIIEACLFGHSTTKGIQISWVDARHIGITVLISSDPDDATKTLNISQEWLSFKSAHEEVLCQCPRANSHGTDTHAVFACDQAALKLYQLILDQLERQDQESPSEFKKRKRSMLEKAEMLVPWMPRGVRVVSMPTATKVSWETNARRLESSKLMGIVLHREDRCSAKRNDLLHLPGSPSQSVINPDCECPAMVVQSKTATFKNLDSRIEYFPVIALSDEGSLTGIPSKCLPPFVAESSESTPAVDGMSVVDNDESDSDYDGGTRDHPLEVGSSYSETLASDDLLGLSQEGHKHDHNCIVKGKLLDWVTLRDLGFPCGFDTHLTAEASGDTLISVLKPLPDHEDSRNNHNRNDDGEGDNDGDRIPTLDSFGARKHPRTEPLGEAGPGPSSSKAYQKRAKFG
ncbi:MAG: hypothetical protein M1820_001341 [Bogoriella megaspora]|nr:MAG: hypothetical protein M1820_001341 [Bogoriella megaspora]